MHQFSDSSACGISVTEFTHLQGHHRTSRSGLGGESPPAAPAAPGLVQGENPHRAGPPRSGADGGQPKRPASTPAAVGLPGPAARPSHRRRSRLGLGAAPSFPVSRPGGVLRPYPAPAFRSDSNLSSALAGASHDLPRCHPPARRGTAGAEDQWAFGPQVAPDLLHHGPEGSIRGNSQAFFISHRGNGTEAHPGRELGQRDHRDGGHDGFDQGGATPTRSPGGTMRGRGRSAAWARCSPVQVAPGGWPAHRDP